MPEFYVYILTNKPNGTLYIGLTNDLKKRVQQHKRKQVKGFTEKYNLSKLVYYESFLNHNEAFQRERRMKKWNRQWKINLIIVKNPEWKDLSGEWFDE